MSDKFLNPVGNATLTDGTADIFINRISINDTDRSKPLKTNSQKQVISSNLEINEINNLTNDLVYKTQLEFTEQLAGYIPQFGHQRMYFKTDEKLYKLNSNNVETEIGGGGGSGGLNYVASTPVIANGLTFRNGLSTTELTNIADFRYDATNQKLVVKDLETDNHFSIDDTLTNISYNIPTTTTNIEGILNMTTGNPIVIQDNNATPSLRNQILIDPAYQSISFKKNGTSNVVDAEVYINSANQIELLGKEGVNLTTSSATADIKLKTNNLCTLVNTAETNGLEINTTNALVYYKKNSITNASVGLTASNTFEITTDIPLVLNSVGNNIQINGGSATLTTDTTPTIATSVATKAYVDTAVATVSPTIPYNIIIAGTDEVNLITTTGQKMEIYAPATFTLNRVAFSTTQAGGVNFSAGIYQNGTLVKAITLGALAYSDQPITPITITKGDILHIKVINVGLSTATGLKCNLEGVYQ